MIFELSRLERQSLVFLEIRGQRQGKDNAAFRVVFGIPGSIHDKSAAGFQPTFSIFKVEKLGLR